MSALPVSRHETAALPIMSAREAAAILGVSETTVRRALRQAREAAPQGQPISGRCQGVAFIAWREPRLPRAPWRFTFPLDRESLAGTGRHEDPSLRAVTEQRIHSLRARIQASVDAAPVEREDADRLRFKRWWKVVIRCIRNRLGYGETEAGRKGRYGPGA